MPKGKPKRPKKVTVTFSEAEYRTLQELFDADTHSPTLASYLRRLVHWEKERKHWDKKDETQ